MKRFFIKKGIIFGLVIGFLLALTTSYAIDSLNSESVSYTKGDKVMSVKQALDDLILKVNEKQDIVLPYVLEVGLNYTEETVYLEKKIDTLLGNLVSTYNGTLSVDKLNKIKNATLKWESASSDIASIDGNKIKGNKVGKTVLYGKLDDERVVAVSVSVVNTSSLIDKVTVGDYVAYDAGTWSEDKDRPTTNGTFGGYKKGQSKNASIKGCWYDTGSSLQGWRVLSKNTESKTVTLVHAGQSECYDHQTNPTSSIELMNSEAQKQYVNTKYATSAHVLNKSEIEIFAPSDTLRYIGNTWYWLADVYTCCGALYAINQSGSISASQHTFSIRPVVELKADIKTSGKGLDEFGQEAWRLIPQ